MNTDQNNTIRDLDQIRAQERVDRKRAARRAEQSAAFTEAVGLDEVLGGIRHRFSELTDYVADLNDDRDQTLDGIEAQALAIVALTKSVRRLRRPEIVEDPAECQVFIDGLWELGTVLQVVNGFTKVKTRAGVQWFDTDDVRPA